MSLESIKYKDGQLEILDQLLLPLKTEFISVKNTQDGWDVIKRMQVRGAPAIAIVGVLSLCAELRQKQFKTMELLVTCVSEKLEFLVTARPTAVNMAEAAGRFTKMAKRLAGQSDMTVDALKDRMLTEMEKMQEEDIMTNKAMGQHGADHILNHCNQESAKVLTHCNTGTLATAGFGTALGVVRALHQRNKLLHCYCTETRPYNQGARLTAYELVYDNIPATLICDSMAAMLMKDRNISAVATGADRVVANGDTANKIGTYQLAIIAKHHGVPFYIVAPSTTCDLNLQSGDQIVIEERPHSEMTSIKGIQIAPTGINCWNPAFDVTPAELITGGIVTEYGVFQPHELKEKLEKAMAKEEEESQL